MRCFSSNYKIQQMDKKIGIQLTVIGDVEFSGRCAASHLAPLFPCCVQICFWVPPVAISTSRVFTSSPYM